MDKRLRSLVVFSGLSLLFVGILWLIAKPFPHVAAPLPFAAVSHNIPYFFYLRAAQWLAGLQPGVVMGANSLLSLLLCGLIFRVGWGVSDPRHKLLGAAMAMMLFELNPLAIILPLTLGFLGGYLLVPLFLLIFVSVMLSIDHWSAFMRAIVLALTWSLFLWVHLPAAIIVLVAMIPWIFYNRRPSVALGTFVTIILLGTAIFSFVWTVGCLLAQRWNLLPEPLHTLQSMWEYVRLGIANAGTDGSDAFGVRFVHMMGWLSPFLVILGFIIWDRTLRKIHRERRTSAVDLILMISLVALAIILFSPGKDTLPGAWYLVMVLAMWAPLIARELANKEHLFTRPARFAFSLGFIASAGVVWLLRHDVLRALLPDAAALLKITISVLVIGYFAQLQFRKQWLPLQNQAESYLFGATLGYFAVMDFWLLR